MVYSKVHRWMLLDLQISNWHWRLLHETLLFLDWIRWRSMHCTWCVRKTNFARNWIAAICLTLIFNRERQAVIFFDLIHKIFLDGSCDLGLSLSWCGGVLRSFADVKPGVYFFLTMRSCVLSWLLSVLAGWVLWNSYFFTVLFFCVNAAKGLSLWNIARSGINV